MTRLPTAAARTPATAWMRRIRFRHLEVLRAIARHGSLTAAAAALDVTQPAISQWLADIEAAAGVRLFVRGQRLRPTAFAAPVLAHAERVLNDAERVAGELEAIRAGGSGLVRIGVMQVGAAALVPTVVLRLLADSPGIALSLVEDVAAGLWARFERNELDVLVSRLDARALASGLPHERLFADRHRIVCGIRHPLLARRRVSWRDAARYPWVMPTPGTPLRDAVEVSFASAGVPLPGVLLSSVSATANPVLMNDSEALGVLSTAAAARLEGYGVLRALPLMLKHDIGDVGLVWRGASPGAALAAVLQAFREVNRGAAAS
jgi:DNA-binding transcriptional LysR family regulator